MLKGIFNSLVGPAPTLEKPKFQLGFSVNQKLDTLVVFKSEMNRKSDFLFLQYDLKTGKFVRRLGDRTNQAIQFDIGFLQLHPCFSPDGRIFVSQGASMPICWDLSTGEPVDLRISDETGGSIFRPTFSPDGSKIAYLVSALKEIQVYDLEQKQLFKIPNHHWVDVPFGSPVFTFKSNEIIETKSTFPKKEELCIREWDVSSGELLSERVQNYIPNMVLSSSSCDPILSSALTLNVRDENEGKIRVRDTKTEEILHQIDLRDYLDASNLIQIDSINFVDDDESIMFGFVNRPCSDPLVINLTTRKISKRFSCPKGYETVKIKCLTSALVSQI